ncbi:hypothetical protein M8818_006665 [Zalaria obscura]|uniref:Uncharacterized protein n=1 Tax=Zalaria obscura TaxID=2024903 RepID=A0ACC3S5I3_9PEZI
MTEKIDDKTNGATHQEVLCGANAGKDGVHKIDEKDLGYDGSLMGSINSVTNYQHYYNLPLNGASSTGIVFAIFQIGQMAGAFFVWVADWQGRRLPIFIGCFGVIIGTIITATAKTLPVFVGGRFLLSFFCTLATTSADTNLNWRLPLWLQMLCPGLVCCFIYFVPESPRWQVAADQHEKARAFIVKHHANGDASHPIVELEMSEIVQSLSTSTLLSWRSFFDIRDLLRTRARRYRTGINFCFSWFGQFSGNNVISYYLPLLVAQVGITNPNTQLLLNAIYAITGWIAAIIGARLHDVLGRRTMFLASTAGMVLCLAIAAGGAAGYTEGSIPASKASISFIYVFGVVFAVAYTSMQPIYPAEVMTNDMRAKGMFLFQWTAGAAGFL